MQDLTPYLDYVSRPAAFARLYPKLLDGYLLDALERLDDGAADQAMLKRFLAAADKAPRSRGRSAGPQPRADPALRVHERPGDRVAADRRAESQALAAID